MQIIETIALITINETLIFQLISFLMFLFILNRIMIRPLRLVMNERKAMLDRISEEIVTTENSFHDVGHQIEAQEKAARKEAFKIRNDIEASGKLQADDILTSTRDEINALKQKFHKETAARLATARKEIEKEALTISDRMIASLLGQRNAP